MSDTCHTITVVLDDVVSEDRAIEICQAIQQIRDVLTAKYGIRDAAAFIAERQAVHNVQMRLIPALRTAGLLP